MTKLASQLIDLQSTITNLENAYLEPVSDLVKDATIKRFELCFEMCWKTLQTFIADSGSETPASPKSCLRIAAELNFISDPSPWFEFLTMRNRTVHMYSKELAHSFFEPIKGFIPLAHDLLSRLQSQP